MKNLTIQKAKDFLAIKDITEINRSDVKGVRHLSDQNEILETKIEAIGLEIINEIVVLIEDVKDCKYFFKGSFTAFFENGSKHYNNDVELFVDQQKEVLEYHLNRILKLGTALINNNLND